MRRMTELLSLGPLMILGFAASGAQGAPRSCDRTKLGNCDGLAANMHCLSTELPKDCAQRRKDFLDTCRATWGCPAPQHCVQPGTAPGTCGCLGDATPCDVRC